MARASIVAMRSNAQGHMKDSMQVTSILKKAAAAAALSVALSSPSWAVIISGGALNGTDVGSADTLLGFTQNNGPTCPDNSNLSSEQCWVNTVLGAGVATLVDRQGTTPLFDTNVANVVAFQLVGTPGYYLVKNASYEALYTNVSNLGWGVINFSALPSGMNINGNTLTISHVTRTANLAPPTTRVPEPGSLGLLGAALLGLGLMRRRWSTR